MDQPTNRKSRTFSRFLFGRSHLNEMEARIGEKKWTRRPDPGLKKRKGKTRAGSPFVFACGTDTRRIRKPRLLPLLNDFFFRERSVLGPATTGMHGNSRVGINHCGSFRVGTSHHGNVRGNVWVGTGDHGDSRTANQPPRECTGVFGWELATAGMHGERWIGNTHKAMWSMF